MSSRNHEANGLRAFEPPVLAFEGKLEAMNLRFKGFEIFFIIKEPPVPIIYKDPVVFIIKLAKNRQFFKRVFD